MAQMEAEFDEAVGAVSAEGEERVETKVVQVEDVPTTSGAQTIEDENSPAPTKDDSTSISSFTEPSHIQVKSVSISPSVQPKVDDVSTLKRRLEKLEFTLKKREEQMQTMADINSGLHEDLEASRLKKEAVEKQQLYVMQEKEELLERMDKLKSIAHKFKSALEVTRKQNAEKLSIESKKAQEANMALQKALQALKVAEERAELVAINQRAITTDKENINMVDSISAEKAESALQTALHSLKVAEERAESLQMRLQQSVSSSSSSTNEKIVTLEKNLNLSNQKVEAAKVEISQLKSSIKSLQQSSAEALKANSILERKVTVRERQLAKRQREFGELHAKAAEEERLRLEIERSLEAERSKAAGGQERALKERHRTAAVQEELQQRERETDALKDASKQHKRKLAEMKSRATEAEDAVASLERRLKACQENFQREVNDAKGALQTANEKRQEMAVRLEEALSESAALRESESKNSEERLAVVENELRMVKNQAEVSASEFSSRITSLQSELSLMRKKWRNAESRCQQASAAASEAARPLALQLQALRAEKDSAASSAAILENTLQERIRSSESIASRARERRQEAEMKVVTLTSNLSSVEDELENTRNTLKDKEKKIEELEKKLEEQTIEANGLSTIVRQLRAQQLKAVQDHTHQLDQLRNDKNLNETKYANLEEKLSSVEEKLKQKEKEISLLKEGKETNTSNYNKVIIDQKNDEKIIEKEPLPQIAGEPSTMVLKGSGPAEITRMRRMLKVKDGEVAALQRKVKSLIEARDALADEMVSLSAKNREYEEAAEQSAKEGPKVKEYCKQLKKKHEVLLIMLGTKDEELEDARVEIEGLTNQIDFFRNALEEKARGNR
eukprot:g1998.t1